MEADNIVLRAFEEIDIDLLQELLNDSHNQELVGGSLTPMSKLQVIEWVLAKKNASNTYLLVISKSKQFCGYIQLVFINPIDGHATLGINIFQRCQGIGLGRFAIKEIHHFAKHKLLLRKIVLYVRSDNISACKLYENLGYAQAGVFRKHVKTNNGYIDLNIMEIIL